MVRHRQYPSVSGHSHTPSFCAASSTAGLNRYGQYCEMQCGKRNETEVAALAAAAKASAAAAKGRSTKTGLQAVTGFKKLDQAGALASKEKRDKQRAQMVREVKEKAKKAYATAHFEADHSYKLNHKPFGGSLSYKRWMHECALDGKELCPERVLCPFGNPIGPSANMDRRMAWTKHGAARKERVHPLLTQVGNTTALEVRGGPAAPSGAVTNRPAVPGPDRRLPPGWDQMDSSFLERMSTDSSTSSEDSLESTRVVVPRTAEEDEDLDDDLLDDQEDLLHEDEHELEDHEGASSISEGRGRPSLLPPLSLSETEPDFGEKMNFVGLPEDALLAYIEDYEKKRPGPFPGHRVKAGEYYHLALEHDEGPISFEQPLSEDEVEWDLDRGDEGRDHAPATSSGTAAATSPSPTALNQLLETWSGPSGDAKKALVPGVPPEPNVDWRALADHGGDLGNDPDHVEQADPDAEYKAALLEEVGAMVPNKDGESRDNNPSSETESSPSSSSDEEDDDGELSVSEEGAREADPDEEVDASHSTFSRETKAGDEETPPPPSKRRDDASASNDASSAEEEELEASLDAEESSSSDDEDEDTKAKRTYPRGVEGKETDMDGGGPLWIFGRAEPKKFSENVEHDGLKKKSVSKKNGGDEIGVSKVVRRGGAAAKATGGLAGAEKRGEVLHDHEGHDSRPRKRKKMRRATKPSALRRASTKKPTAHHRAKRRPGPRMRPKHERQAAELSSFAEMASSVRRKFWGEQQGVGAPLDVEGSTVPLGQTSPPTLSLVESSEREGVYPPCDAKCNTDCGHAGRRRRDSGSDPVRGVCNDFCGAIHHRRRRRNAMECGKGSFYGGGVDCRGCAYRDLFAKLPATGKPKFGQCKSAMFSKDIWVADPVQGPVTDKDPEWGCANYCCGRYFKESRAFGIWTRAKSTTDAPDKGSCQCYAVTK